MHRKNSIPGFVIRRASIALFGWLVGSLPSPPLNFLRQHVFTSESGCIIQGVSPRPFAALQNARKRFNVRKWLFGRYALHLDPPQPRCHGVGRDVFPFHRRREGDLYFDRPGKWHLFRPRRPRHDHGPGGIP